MNLIQTSEGALNVLTAALGSSPTLVLRLFSNNVTISDSTVFSDLTECSFAGYAAVSPAWPAPSLTAGVAGTLSPSATFTYSGGTSTTIYGAYITDSGNTKLYGACNFSPAVVLTPSQPSYVFQANYTQTSQY